MYDTFLARIVIPLMSNREKDEKDWFSNVDIAGATRNVLMHE